MLCCEVFKKPNNIQGVSWLADITAGGDFLGLCYKKSSYKHVSDFGRLRSYGHFLIPVHALVWTAYGTSWQVMYSTCWFIVCHASTDSATQLHSPQSVSQHLEGIWGTRVWLVGIRLVNVYCMTQPQIHVQKPLSLTLQWLHRHMMLKTTVRQQFRKGVPSRSDSVMCVLVP
jgi:hypothetical protein